MNIKDHIRKYWTGYLLILIMILFCIGMYILYLYGDGVDMSWRMVN